MSGSSLSWGPKPSLVTGTVSPGCRAVVIVPARNEHESLPATLDALYAQQTLHGEPLGHDSYEVILLLNNCTDTSLDVASAWAAEHLGFPLHIVEHTFELANAHVGTARQLLMDTAWSRLRAASHVCGILSTDSDTVVAPDWIAQNLHALEAGADAVGGVIELRPGELDALPLGARTSYKADREYQRLVAELESRLDPQKGDPWPRHLEHFGASLACTPEIYARVGGMPAVNPLEDLAFVDRLRRVDARLRHDPAVRVRTSSRFDGRASVGLSWQLRTWQAKYEAGEAHTVESASFLQHRFDTLRQLRGIHAAGSRASLGGVQEQYRARIRNGLEEMLTVGEFLGRIDCNTLIEESFTGIREELVDTTIEFLRALLRNEAGGTEP